MDNQDTVLLTVHRYILVLIIPILGIGFLFNPIVLYILSRPKFIKESMFRYFIATEINDTFMLIFWFMMLIKSFLLNVSWPEGVTCKLTQYITGTFLFWYQLLSTLISVDRLMAIKYKNNFQFRNTLKFQSLSVISLLSVSALCNVPFYLYTDLNNSSQCVFEDPKVAISIYLSGTICFNAFPFMIRLVSTIIIVNYLIQQKKRMNQAQIDYKREFSFLKNVLTMDIWFFFCYMPAVIFNLILHIYSININVNLILLIVHDLFVVLIIIQASCNFFVFSFCNKLFREEFRLIFKCCSRRIEPVIGRKNLNATVEIKLRK
jgi:hypothetical protein